jgi:hypothetical protein
MSRDREMPDFDGPSRNQSKEFNRKAKLTVDTAQVQAGHAARLVESIKEVTNAERTPGSEEICCKVMDLILKSEFNIRLALQVSPKDEY